MVDIFYAWSKLEENLLDPVISRAGYLHGDQTKFYNDCNLDRIWVVRMEDKKLWLLGFLAKPKKIEKPSDKLKKNSVSYDPASSEFFLNPLSVESKVSRLLADICRKSVGPRFIGSAASGLIQEPYTTELREAVSDEPTISFMEMTERLKNGAVDYPPYRRQKNSTTAASARPKIAASQPIAPPLFPLNPLNKPQVPITPDEAENRRKKQAENGALGELLAMDYECERLKKLGCLEPLKFVNHIALEDTGAGYDIESSWNNEERFIEVKTSQTGREEFFISANEVETLKNLGERGWLYLVNLSKQNDPGGCVEEKENAGEQLSSSYTLTATQFRATPKG